MRRREFLAVPALALAAAERQPDIVLFYADDLDADELGWSAKSDNYPSPTRADQRGYSDPRMLTPNIDKLAREGAELTRFYITSPVCTPSRTSLLTGKYASRALVESQPPPRPAIIQWNTHIRPADWNVAKELKKLGYVTGIVGKWHNFPGEEKLREVDPGFELEADPRDPAIKARLEERHRRACEALRLRYGFDFADRINIGNTEQSRPAAIRGQNLEWHTEGALEFLRQKHNRPLFLYYPLPVPHGAYRDIRKLNPLATTAGLLDKPPAGSPSRESVYERLEKAGIEQRNSMATWMDDAVGVLLDAIPDPQNTIVLFISDHASRGKNSVYEGARVIATVRWPKRIKPGTRVDSLCANLDVPATLIEAAGAKPPATDGRSFLPQLLGKPEPKNWRRELLLEIHNSRAVVTRKYKYVANRVVPEVLERVQAREVFWHNSKTQTYNLDRDFPAYFDSDQLYDLEDDLFERRNLAGDPKYANALSDMRQRMARALASLPHAFGEFRR